MSSACCALCLCSATTRSAKAGYLRSALQTQVGTTLRANMATSCAQATYQNERWTGRKALRSVMARAICEHFGAASGLEAVLAHEFEVVACGLCCMLDAADAVFVFWCLYFGRLRHFGLKASPGLDSCVVLYLCMYRYKLCEG